MKANTNSKNIITQPESQGNPPANGNSSHHSAPSNDEVLRRELVRITQEHAREISEGSALEVPDNDVPMLQEILDTLDEVEKEGGPETAKDAAEAMCRGDEGVAALLGEFDPDSTASKWNGQVLTLGDAYKPRPPREWVVFGLLPSDSVSLAYGAPSSMKTMGLMDLCACVASGKPWLLPAPGSNHQGTGFKTVKAPVLWLDFDNGEHEMLSRLKAFGTAHKLPEHAPFKMFTMLEPWLDISDSDHVQSLVDLIKRHQAKLVVIDNLSLISGGIDENSSSMTRIMIGLRTIAEQTHSAVVVIHHKTKGNGNGGVGDDVRGHGCVRAGVDAAFHFGRQSLNSKTVTVKATKVRGVEIAPFSMVLVEQNDANRELLTAQFYGVGDANPSSDSAKASAKDNKKPDAKNDEAIKKTILEMVEEAGTFRGKGDLIKAVMAKHAGLSDKVVGRMIDQLVDDKELDDDYTNGTLFYTVLK